MTTPLPALDQLRGLREELARSQTLDELTEVCSRLSRECGFAHFVYAVRLPTHFADARVISLDGYPQGWVARYFEQAYYEVDPVMAHCARHALPVRWSDLPVEPGSRAERMMADAASFGLREGVSMPVHSPLGELGVLSLALDADPAQVRAHTEAALSCVHLMAAHVHEAVRRVSGPPMLRRPLSPRETDCLRWAADGKTSAEIGLLLGMAESTANFHLNNAMQKLGVANRQQAVALAALSGLIQPKPF